MYINDIKKNCFKLGSELMAKQYFLKVDFKEYARGLKFVMKTGPVCLNFEGDFIA